MLKKIAIDQLRPGMFLHRVEGSWWDSPFWRLRLRIEDAAQIERLVQAGIGACWIDLQRGLDVPASLAPTDPREAAPARPQTASLAVASATFDAECARAERLVGEAKRLVFDTMNRARAARPIDVDACRATVDDIAASLARHPSAMLGVTRLKCPEDQMVMHSVAVSALMVCLARKLGLDEQQVKEAGLAGLLHDIGKIAVPEAILNKPGPLTDAEFSIVKGHSRAGHDLLRATPEVGEGVIDTCLRHHERPDGKGYPGGVHGDALSLQARMAAVCDVYDAITSDRPYKRGWCPADSLLQMSAWAKAGQFDGYVFRAFVECVGVFPIGSLVRLASQRLAVVVENHPVAMRSPRVRVFHSARDDLPVPLETLDLNLPGCDDAIVAREPRASWNATQLAALTRFDAPVSSKAAAADLQPSPS